MRTIRTKYKKKLNGEKFKERKEETVGKLDARRIVEELETAAHEKIILKPVNL